jgi:putative ATP-dependent endonuclease of the OLD family
MQNRIRKVSIRNFGCIGSQKVDIDIDKIVLLVGQNNVGKSSILRALKIITDSSGKDIVDISDFHNEDKKNTPEIIVETIIEDDTNLNNKEWINDDGDGVKYVKERWQWKEPGQPPDRRGWKVKKQSFANDTDDPKTPWTGGSQVLAGRPEPHEINPFDNPEIQTEQIRNLLNEYVESKIESLISDESHEDNIIYKQIIKDLKKLKTNLVKSADSEITGVQNQINSLVKDVFPGYTMEFDPQPDEDISTIIRSTLITKSSSLRLGKENGYKSVLHKQGSGVRRTLLWMTLKLSAELGRTIKRSKTKKESPILSRQHILLINEPEICLHPSAVRDARDTLYKLPDSENWQVFVTTHSPLFIDLTKDNTTIVRVEKNEEGVVSGDTIYRPELVHLTEEEKLNLKIQNIFDPYFAEFFFANQVIVVEGDTEYSVFRYLLEEQGRANGDIHIIRARGKAIIPTIIKILNHFKKSYSVLHDADQPTIEKTGNRQAMWTINKNILSTFNDGKMEARLIACLPDFEHACGFDIVTKDKPYSACKNLERVESLDKARQILTALTNFDTKVPDGFAQWRSIEELEAKDRSTNSQSSVTVAIPVR